MPEQWEGNERRRTVQLVDTSQSLTDEELKELKALAAYSKAARWLVAGVIATAGFFGLDRILAWLKH